MTSKGDHELIKHLILSTKPEINSTVGGNRETFFFHSDIFYNFMRDSWIWKSTKTPVEALGSITGTKLNFSGTEL